MAKTCIKVNLPEKLLVELEELLVTRNLKIDDVVRLYLRSIVTSSKSSKALNLHDELTIGKFKGELLEVIIRAEPKYISWLLANTESFKITPEALELLEQILK